MRLERTQGEMSRNGLVTDRTPFETRKPEFGGALGRS
jgi:hypothetical protein